MNWRQKAQTAILTTAFLVSGCIFYPHPTEQYNNDCDLTARRLELRSTFIAGMCRSETDPRYDYNGTGCLVGLLTLSAGSAIVSGSVVVVGNTVYWLEEKASCAKKDMQ